MLAYMNSPITKMLKQNRSTIYIQTFISLIVHCHEIKWQTSGLIVSQ
mgnify:CR=1 FL=1